jgi:hypothetical protein
VTTPANGLSAKPDLSLYGELTAKQRIEFRRLVVFCCQYEVPLAYLHNACIELFINCVYGHLQQAHLMDLGYMEPEPEAMAPLEDLRRRCAALLAALYERKYFVLDNSGCTVFGPNWPQ